MRRVVGQVILASAIIDDSIGWIIVSIIFSLALHGSVEPMSLAQSVIGTVAFMIASLTIGRRAVFLRSAGSTIISSANSRWSPPFSASWASWPSSRI